VGVEALAAKAGTTWPSCSAAKVEQGAWATWAAASTLALAAPRRTTL
jgi:hypothetical protein